MNNNTRKILAVLFGLMILVGSWIVFILPGQMANKVLTEGQGKFERVNKQYSEIMVKSEEMGWLKKKYAASIKSSLKKAREKIEEAGGKINIAKASSADGKKNNSEKAVVLLEDAALSLKTISDELAFQEEARHKAEPTLVQAKKEFDGARNYLESARNSFGLEKALKKIFEKKTRVAGLLEQSEKALRIAGEDGKLDFVSAYEKGVEALRLSSEIIRDADEQVGFLTAIPRDTERLKKDLVILKYEIASADKYYNTLTRYHNKLTWQSVASNINSSHSAIEAFNGAIWKTEALFREQELSEASIACKEAESILKNINHLVLSLKNHTEKLERYREAWPDAERRAKSTISDEEDYVDKYGSYDSSARSDFEDAEEYLGAARSFADRKDFESAVKKAKKAEDLAAGTGDRAYSAYEDEQEEERRRASNDDDSSSIGGGFSGGFGSSDSSDFGGSDIGGWDGESSSDGGGWD